MVHVGAVDAPVTIADVKAISREVWKAAGASGGKAAVDVLGWEFALAPKVREFLTRKLLGSTLI